MTEMNHAKTQRLRFESRRQHRKTKTQRAQRSRRRGALHCNRPEYCTRQRVFRLIQSDLRVRELRKEWNRRMEHRKTDDRKMNQSDGRSRGSSFVFFVLFVAAFSEPRTEIEPQRTQRARRRELPMIKATTQRHKAAKNFARHRLQGAVAPSCPLRLCGFA